MTLERRFDAGMRESENAEPGLVLGDDGITYLIAADGTRSAVGSGGSSSFTDILVVTQANAVIADPLGSGYTAMLADFTVADQVGTDISMVAGVGGALTFASAAGGSFGASLFCNINLAADGGNTDLRLLSLLFNGDASNAGLLAGLDAIAPLADGVTFSFQQNAQPYPNRPVGNIIPSRSFQAYLNTGSADDVVTLSSIYIVVWKLGGL